MCVCVCGGGVCVCVCVCVGGEGGWVRRCGWVVCIGEGCFGVR